jgi:hypothetical protein
MPIASSSSSFTVAIPFLVNSLLLFLTPFLGLAIQSRLRSVFSELGWAEPNALAQTAVWIGDATQIVAAAMGPLVGLLILRPNLGNGIALLYVGSFVLAFGGFLWFTFKVRVDGYGDRRWRIPFFTPLVVGGLVLNLLAAGVAALLGP